MPLWLVIGIGSFIGGILRFLVSGWIQSGAITFPFGTLGVNFLQISSSICVEGQHAR